jgi:hypothetical protein
MAARSKAVKAMDLRARCLGPSYISKFVPPNMSTIRKGWASVLEMFAAS